MNYPGTRRDGSKLKKGKKFTYQVKSYQNPYFNNKKRQVYTGTIWQWKQKIIITGILLVIVFFLWLLFSSPLFKIRNIVINNLSENISTSTPVVDEENAKQIASAQKNVKVLIIFSQDNFFLYKTEEVKNKLNDIYPFYFFSITKGIRGTLSIEYKTKDFTAVWIEDDKYFFVDSDGKVISEINPLELKQKKYPLIKNTGSERIQNGIIPKVDAGKLIIEINNNINLSQSELKLENFEINDEEYTIKLKLQNGPEILFSTKIGVEEQLNKLTSVKESLKDDFLKQSYIDLRFGDRVYAK